ncbi:GAF domain-containing sensor histidine kinase [Pontibacter sp. KCTC 32443]|nr:GAF domain-containing sensor histidine kinase [Pontibacter sp. KCTC 32443]
MPAQFPVQPEEFDRVKDLSEFDLDYASLENNFTDLLKLAAQVAGTEISLLNLIDAYTLWTVAGHGFPTGQTPRENSVCQYTILEPEQFEVKNLMLDSRFRNLQGVKDGPQLRYYFGLPLKTRNGQSIGSLCVLDTSEKNLTQDKIGLLKIIANEVVSRLTTQQQVQALRQQLAEAKEVNKRVAHDIRGPIGGIIGLAKMISRKADSHTPEEIQKLSQHIYTSGTSLLDLADEILTTGKKADTTVAQLQENSLTLQQFKDKLTELYQPQATDKGIVFEVETNPDQDIIAFPKNKLMQITGNLISNAFKFTPPLGAVTVKLNILPEPNVRMLHIQVIDNGIGITDEQLAEVMNGRQNFTTIGTDGEQGFGLGLQLVKHLVNSLQGTFRVTSVPGQGTSFELKIPVGIVSPILSN